MIVSFRSLHDCLCYNFTRFLFFAVYTIFVLIFFCFPLIKNRSRKPLYIKGFRLWRRARDSNPRNAFDVYTISNRAPSTSSDNSPCLQSNARLLYMTALKKSSLFSKILNFLFLHSRLSNKPVFAWNQYNM